MACFWNVCQELCTRLLCRRSYKSWLGVWAKASMSSCCTWIKHGKRSRWWALIVPKEYDIKLMDLPKMDFLNSIAAVFPTWPIWPLEVEEQLRLTVLEKQLYFDKSYGRDLRHLTPRDNAPCLLHSYGHALDSCPCGCRGLFNPLRLLKDGLRGFFIWGAQLQDYRFLHPAEAALLCTVPPATTFPSPTRAGLCLVGQCAAPLQAVWILAHVQTFWNSPCFASPQMALGSYQTFLLRQAHGFFQTTSNKFHITLQDDSEWKLIQSTL